MSYGPTDTREHLERLETPVRPMAGPTSSTVEPTAAAEATEKSINERIARYKAGE